MIFYCRTLHILIKALVFLFLLLQSLGFCFSYYFCTSNNKIKLFYKQTQIFDEMLKSLKFFIPSFISSYFLNTLFTKKNLSRLIYELINALEIKSYMLFNLVFANNTILSCFFFFFLIINSYFLIPVVIAQIFILTAVLVIPKGIPAKKAKTEIETHQVTAKAKVSKRSIKLKVVPTFVCFLFINSFLVYFFNKIIPCSVYIFQSKFLTLFSSAIFIFKVIVYLYDTPLHF